MIMTIILKLGKGAIFHKILINALDFSIHYGLIERYFHVECDVSE